MKILRIVSVIISSVLLILILLNIIYLIGWERGPLPNLKPLLIFFIISIIQLIILYFLRNWILGLVLLTLPFLTLLIVYKSSQKPLNENIIIPDNFSGVFGIYYDIPSMQEIEVKNNTVDYYIPSTGMLMIKNKKRLQNKYFGGLIQGGERKFYINKNGSLHLIKKDEIYYTPYNVESQIIKIDTSYTLYYMDSGDYRGGEAYFICLNKDMLDTYLTYLDGDTVSTYDLYKLTEGFSLYARQMRQEEDHFIYGDEYKKYLDSLLMEVDKYINNKHIKTNANILYK